jgi:hypothetical protein
MSNHDIGTYWFKRKSTNSATSLTEQQIFEFKDAFSICELKIF